MNKYFNFLIIMFLILLQELALAQFGPEDLIRINTISSFDKVNAGGQFKIAVKINIKDSWHINSDKPKEDYLIPSQVNIQIQEGFRLEKTNYPPAEEIKLGFSDTPLSAWQGEILIGSLFSVDKNISEGSYKLIINFDYQACNDMTCLPPSSVTDTLIVQVVSSQSVSNEINQDEFKKIDLSYTDLSSEIKKTTESDNSISNMLENNGLFLGLLFVFIGGLALNLTPCVYPLIPITIGFFGGQSEGKTIRLFGMGLLFVVGMAVTYSVIGVVTALSGAVFGSLLQNPIVIIIIALIFLILSLSMFGLYEFQLPNSWVAKAGGAKGGFYGAFFMGLTMGIVAAPCIGPFVLGLVTYVAAKADPYLGFLMFFVLALGLGFPYLLLAIFSGKIKKLPRAGEWMDGVKHIFGFILIGMALYFIVPLLPKSFSGYVLPIFMIITAVYLLVFDKLGNSVKGFKNFKIVFSILLMALAVYNLLPSADNNSIDWQEYSESKLSDSIGQTPVIIDFYADWCIPCKELDAITFSDAKVIEESRKFLSLKADMTKSLSPEVESLRNKFKIVGVPTVLILDSNGSEINRITGFVNAEEFINIIKSIQ
ncbi:MAG TPA: cytochrome c biogenesis protein CcdA [Ignavibacteriaceae bacterium]|nr:cytochrome c biogenesis protein CcdA [Ignavibacteriaceae bacterium]